MSSTLSNCFKIYLNWRVVPVVALFLLGDFSVYAQNKDRNVSENKVEVVTSNPKRLATSEFPSQITETNTKKKSGWINNAIDWYRNKTLPGDLQIHGFVSQAYILTSHNDVFGNSDKGGSFGFTEAGLNASLRPLPKLLVSAQVLSRRAGEGNTGMPRLDFAFLDYRLYSHEANQFGIRVGRIKNPLGFYNETRDVAFTRPSILLPQSIYFDRTRNLGLSSDSVQLYGDIAHPTLGTFFTQFGVALPVVDDRDTESSLLRLEQPGRLTREVGYIGRGIYETNDKRIRLAVSGTWVNIGYDPGKMDTLGPGSIQFSPVYFSAQYNAERWTLTSEYALRHFVYKDFGRANRDFFGESFYFQGEYRFTPKFEGIVRYDVLFTDRSDRNGKEFAANDPLHQPAYSRYARDITVGLRWNVTPEFMLRAEYHHVTGTAWLSTLDNPLRMSTDRTWDLFAVQASYRF